MKKIFFGLALTFLSIGLFAQEINFSGDLSTNWGLYSPWTEEAWDFSLGKTDFTGAIEAYSGNSTCFFESSIGYDFAQSTLSASINEAYIDYTESFWGIRIGRQKWAWGKADGINITNSVFPEDSSSLFTEDSSLGLDSFRLSFYGNSFTLDAMWIPFFRGTVLPLEDSNPLKKYIVPETYTLSIPEYDLEKEIAISIGSITEPELKIKNGEYALKASGYFRALDLSLYAFYGWDKSPILNYTGENLDMFGIPDTITVDASYQRLTMFGLDVALPIGEFVLRSEGAFFPNRHFQTSADYILSDGETSLKQNQLMGLAGLDWMPNGWTITAQYYCDYVFNKSQDLDRTQDYIHGASLSISKTLLNESLNLSLSGILALNYYDSVITFDCDYSLSDQISLATGLYAFIPGPEEDGTYGKYKDLSTIYIKAQYKF
ncbi:MAG: hypothetical protein K6C97_03800 [Treponema sp.]|nr:hypothetical protein [Treponema sp.]